MQPVREVRADAAPPRRSSGHRGLLGRLRHGERGTAVVEFALVAPILFLLVFGIVEFGRALNYYNDLTQLAGQGARAAAVSRNPDGTAVGATSGTVTSTCNGDTYSIQCQLADYYTSSGELRNGITVCIPSVPAQGDAVTVHASYTFNFSVGLFGFATLDLSSTHSERAEALPTYTAGDQTGNSCT